jgi:threonine dehydrogenase-like Zn-dependent dehydrogenase
MRAVTLLSPGVVALSEVDEPNCGDDEVVVQISAVGLCGSDLAVYDGHRRVPRHPWVLGHEGGGTVVRVGSAVTDRHEGQRVVIEPNIPCFTCQQCLQDRTSLCPQRRILGMNRPGIAAERVSVPAHMTWPVPMDWGPDRLVTLEPFAVAVAATRRSGITPSDEALIVGAGALGQQLCRALLSVGITPDITDVDRRRVAAAERLGARPTGDERRYRFVFETAGASAAIAAAIAALAGSGTLTLLGLEDSSIEFHPAEFVRRGQVLRGSIIYDHPSHFRAAVELHMTSAPPPAVAQGMPPQEAQRAFKQARATPLKSWIDLSEW